MQSAKPFLLLIGLLLGGLALTAILGSMMDARNVEQELRREQVYRQS